MDCERGEGVGNRQDRREISQLHEPTDSPERIGRKKRWLVPFEMTVVCVREKWKAKKALYIVPVLEKVELPQ